MLELYNASAVLTLNIARDEAERSGRNAIGTEHILLALIAERGGLTGKAIDASGMKLKAAREAVKAIADYGDEKETEEEVTFTPRATALLESAYNDATRLNHAYVGTEHLLLAILALHEGLAVDALRKLDPDIPAMRSLLLDGLGDPAQPKKTSPNETEPLTWTWKENLARRLAFMGPPLGIMAVFCGTVFAIVMLSSFLPHPEMTKDVSMLALQLMPVGILLTFGCVHANRVQFTNGIDSMGCTFRNNEFVMVDKTVRFFNRKLKRGDIISFHIPPNARQFMGQANYSAFIKRLIGLPGDRIELRRNEGVFVNGALLEEPYLTQPCPADLRVMGDIGGFVGADEVFPYRAPDLWEKAIVVPPGYLFVLGDNRRYSLDSRAFGFVKETLVQGRVLVACWRKFVAPEPVPDNRSDESRALDLDACLARAAAMVRLGRLKEAMSDCDAVIKAEANWWQAFALRGFLLTAEKKREESEHDLRLALQLAQQEKAEGKDIAQIYVTLSANKYMCGNFEECIESCTKAYELDKKCRGCLALKAAALIDLQRADEALPVCQQFLDDQGPEDEILNVRSVAMLATGAEDQARADNEKLLAITKAKDIPAPYGHLNAANLALIDGNLDKARSHWFQALASQVDLLAALEEGVRAPASHYTKVSTQLSDKFGTVFEAPEMDLLLRVQREFEYGLRTTAAQANSGPVATLPSSPVGAAAGNAPPKHLALKIVLIVFFIVIPILISLIGALAYFTLGTFED